MNTVIDLARMIGIITTDYTQDARKLHPADELSMLQLGTNFMTRFRTCLAVIALSWFLFATVPARSQVAVHYINVGQAAAALIEFPSGLVMIDAGGEDTSDHPSAEVYRQHL